MTKPIRQGDADGLCGIYAILNFLNLQKGWKFSDNPNALQFVLDVAYDHGWLTPRHIVGGYEAYHLKQILNTLFENYSMQFQAFNIVEIDREKSESSFVILKRILAEKGAIIGGPTGNHWVLLIKSKDGDIIVNSDARDPTVRKFDGRSSQIDISSGVVILPITRNLLEIANNAHRH